MTGRQRATRRPRSWTTTGVTWPAPTVAAARRLTAANQASESLAARRARRRRAATARPGTGPAGGSTAGAGRARRRSSRGRRAGRGGSGSAGPLEGAGEPVGSDGVPAVPSPEVQRRHRATRRRSTRRAPACRRSNRPPGSQSGPLRAHRPTLPTGCATAATEAGGQPGRARSSVQYDRAVGGASATRRRRAGSRGLRMLARWPGAVHPRPDHRARRGVAHRDVLTPRRPAVALAADPLARRRSRRTRCGSSGACAPGRRSASGRRGGRRRAGAAGADRPRCGAALTMATTRRPGYRPRRRHRGR